MNQTHALKSKDLIVAGAFAALYIVVMFLGVSVIGFIPLLYLLAPLILGIILGPIFMLYVMKVPKRGAILILALLVGLITSMGGVWMALIWSLLCGLVAEIVAGIGKYSSKKLYTVSYCAFACTIVGPFWLLVLAKDTFLESTLAYYGQDYVTQLDALTPSWIILVLIGLALVGGLIGATLGKRLLKKHFEKAGVI